MTYSLAIADDHLLIAKALTGIIENFRNYHVLYEVEHGKALMEKMAMPKNIPDIVLLDISMPVMDGFTATKEIRRFNNETPIIALTASASAELLEKILDNGFNDHVLKPFAPKDLNRSIAKALLLG